MKPHTLFFSAVSLFLLGINQLSAQKTKGEVFKGDTTIVLEYNNKGKLRYEHFYIGKRLLFYRWHNRLGKKYSVHTYNGKTKEKEGLDLFYFDGNLVNRRYFKDNVKHGLSQQFDKGQLVMEANYQNGDRHGEVRSYYKNGNLEGITNYRKGILHGKVTVYYESGDLMQEYSYSKGKLNGQLTFYRKDGSTEYIEHYRNGKKSGCWRWFEKENVVLEKCY